MSERANPFRPGAGLNPPHLAGRELEREMFARMLRGIKDGMIGNIAVHGLRGMGKTVLLREFEQMCRDGNFLPVSEPQYSPHHSEPSEFVGVLKYNMRTAIETFSRSKTKSRIRSAVCRIKPSAGATGIYYEPPYEPRHTPLRDYMADYLIENWNVVEKGGHDGVVFLFDEFHTIRDSESDNRFVLSDFIGALDEVQKRGYRYAAVLCGLPVLQSNLKAARSYSEKMFQPLRVSFLEEEAAKDAITKPLEGIGRSFSRDLVNAIVRDTGGYPYFVQFYAKEILDCADGDGVGMRDYGRVKGEITAILDQSFFDQRMEELTEGQRAVLDAMAQIPDADVAFSVLKKRTGISKGAFSRNLARLGEEGLIRRAERGVYRFSLPVLRDCLLWRSAPDSKQVSVRARRAGSA